MRAAANDWRLVGRGGELRFLRRLITAGELPGIVLAGAAGVGKTRLATELLTWADGAGLATARVVATRSTRPLPFGALAPLLPAVSPGETAVQEAAGPYGPAVGEPGSPSNWGTLLRMLTAALLEPAGDRRLVLFVDDAHQLDDASATLIHQLALTGSAFVLATIRSGEPAPGPVTALWKDGLVERRELEGLTLSAVEEVLVTALGGAVDAAAVNQLWSRCQGNMLFLRELVLGALRDRSLRQESGIWRLAGSSPPPERLVELVEARLAGLGDEERALLEVVSFGEPLGPAELAGVADPALAESLERQGLIMTGRNGRRLELRLAHPMYGEVLRARIPGLRVPAIARSLAEVVEATGARRREDTLRVATWRLDGGGAQPDLMLAAATIARWRYAFPLAERLAQAAIDAGAGFEAALLVALLAGLQGRTDEAGRRMAALTDQASNDAERGRLATARIDNYVFYTGRLQEGLKIAEEAEAAITDPLWRDEIAARRCGLVLGVEGPAAAAKVAEPLLERATGAALGMAGHLGAYCLGRLGRLTAAREAAQRVGAAMQSHPPSLDWYAGLHAFFLAEALAYGGALDEAYALAAREYERAVAEGSSEAQAWFDWQLAKMVAERGVVATAARHGREGAVVFQRLGRPLFESYCLTNLALALALAGEAETAAQALSELDALRIPPNLFMTVETLRARGWTAAAAGQTDQAVGFLREAASLGERIGDRVGEAAALHDVARLGQPAEVLPRLVQLSRLVEGRLVAARLAHAAALAHEDAGALEEVSTAFEAMGARLLAAEAAAHAALTRRRRGERQRAAEDEDRARWLAEQGEGIATPALQAIGLTPQNALPEVTDGGSTVGGRGIGESRRRDPSAITPREADLLRLAAAGMSNRAIAENLELSVNTVRTQFQKLLEKLGAHSKLEAVAVARQRGLIQDP